MPVTIFEHVSVFDGLKLHVDQSVVVHGPTIAAVGRGFLAPSDATVIDGAGKTLLPGLIDAHTHTMSTDLHQAHVFWRDDGARHVYRSAAGRCAEGAQCPRRCSGPARPVVGGRSCHRKRWPPDPVCAFPRSMRLSTPRASWMHASPRARTTSKSPMKTAQALATCTRRQAVRSQYCRKRCWPR